MKNFTNQNSITPDVVTQHSREKSPLFSLGAVVATSAVALHLSENNIEIHSYLSRHLQGDWGDVPPEDIIENDYAAKNGLRVLSAYIAANRRVWIITEADRSVTTFLFPEEY